MTQGDNDDFDLDHVLLMVTTSYCAKCSNHTTRNKSKPFSPLLSYFSWQCVYLIVYVDDIVILSNDYIRIFQLKENFFQLLPNQRS
ncbi:hypothetical protein CR513_38813, partial [Mucuna pruriens]